MILAEGLTWDESVVRVLTAAAGLYVTIILPGQLWYQGRRRKQQEQRQTEKLEQIHDDVREDRRATEAVHSKVNGGPDGLESRITAAIHRSNRAQESHFFQYVEGKVAPLSERLEKIEKTICNLHCMKCGAEIKDECPDCPDANEQED